MNPEKRTIRISNHVRDIYRRELGTDGTNSDRNKRRRRAAVATGGAVVFFLAGYGYRAITEDGGHTNITSPASPQTSITPDSGQTTERNTDAPASKTNTPSVTSTPSSTEATQSPGPEAIPPELKPDSPFFNITKYTTVFDDKNYNDVAIHFIKTSNTFGFSYSTYVNNPDTTKGLGNLFAFFNHNTIEPLKDNTTLKLPVDPVILDVLLATHNELPRYYRDDTATIKRITTAVQNIINIPPDERGKTTGPGADKILGYLALQAQIHPELKPTS